MQRPQYEEKAWVKRGRPRNAVPTLQHHRAKNTAYVVVGGKTISMGRWGSEEAEHRYREFLSDHLAGGAPLQSRTAAVMADLTVTGLAIEYVRWAKAHYVKRGKPTQFALNADQALSLLDRSGLGREPIGRFGPRALKAFQLWLAKAVKMTKPKPDAAGKVAKPRPQLDAKTRKPIPAWSRATINEYVAHVLRCLRWGVSEELVDEALVRSLESVPALRSGRPPAPGIELREGSPVAPVPDHDFELTLEKLTPTVAAMARVQSLSAMRPSEVCLMQVGQLEAIEQDGERLYLYRVPPTTNKMQHKGRTRVVALGPQASAIIRPRLLDKAPTDFVFTPAESLAEATAARRAKRKTKRWKSHETEARRERRGQSAMEVNPSFNVNSYARAIKRAAAAAGVEAWSPNQIRHAGATRVARVADLQTAQLMLGHADIRTTQIYAEASREKAIAAARKLG